MKRVLLFIFFIFGTGAAVGLALKPEPKYVVYIIPAALAVSVARYIKGRKIICLIYFLIFVIGVYASSHRIYKIESSTKDFLGQYVTINGQIAGDIEKDGHVSAYSVYVDSIEVNDNTYYNSCNIRVIDYKNSPGYIRPFGYISISGKLDNRELYNNSGSFSYKTYLLRNGISGILLADYIPGISPSISSKRALTQMVYKLRNKLENVIDKYIKGHSSQMMKGMLFGDTSGVEENDYKKFQDCGLAHIFAVSGFNMWILYYTMLKALFFVRKHQVIKALIIIIILGVYTALAGASPSVIRAYIMVVLVIIGKNISRVNDPLTSLSAAALIILVFNPLVIVDPGFQLSIACVASLIMLNPRIRKIKLPFSKNIKDMIVSSLSVQIGILPLVAYYFNSYPVFSLLSNILIGPVVSIFTLMGFILLPVGFILPGFAILLGNLIGLVGQIILCTTRIISSIPYSNLNVLTPGILEIIAYYLLVAAVFKIVTVRDRYKKVISYLIIILVLSRSIAGALPSDLKISFIDVGQGDCILIKTPDRKYVLVDGGGKYKNSYSSIDIGEDVVLPYLYKSSVSKLDMVISSHGHEDHLNGLIPVMSTLRVDNFIKQSAGSQESYQELMDKGIINKEDVVDVEKGDVIEAGRYVKIYILNPSGGEMGENDSSIVLRLVYKDFSLLLTGDISVNAEEALMGQDVESDVLKVPHHGSAGSLGIEFLERVNPAAAVICVGQNNFGHPADATLQKITERGIKLLRTDIDGEITITTRGNSFKIKTAAQR